MRESALVARLRAAGCVYAEEEAAVLIAAADGSPSRLDQLVARRISGEPLEQVVGWAEFAGLRIGVDPGVFVPRGRTQCLVRQAVGLLEDRSRPLVVDLCCGSGAIGVAIAAATSAVVHAVDLGPVAVRCAQRNLAPYGGTVYEGDLYDPLPRELLGRIDLIVANAPYVPSDEIDLLPHEARDHEPPLALDGGPDGTSVLRRVIVDAARWLTPTGSLIVESSRRQAGVLVGWAEGAGFEASVFGCPDLDGTGVRCTPANPGWSAARRSPAMS